MEGLKPLLISIPQAGQALSLSRSNIYNLMNDQVIESVKCGKRRMVVTESLERYVNRLRGHPQADAAAVPNGT